MPVKPSGDSGFGGGEKSSQCGRRHCAMATRVAPALCFLGDPWSRRNAAAPLQDDAHFAQRGGKMGKHHEVLGQRNAFGGHRSGFDPCRFRNSGSKDYKRKAGAASATQGKPHIAAELVKLCGLAVLRGDATRGFCDASFAAGPENCLGAVDLAT